MVSDRIIDSPQYNVRRWFENLASGKDRASAVAITDAAFIEMFLDIACKSKSEKAEEIPSVTHSKYDLDELAQGDGSTSEVSASLHPKDLEVLSDTYIAHTSLVDKLTYDAGIGTMEESNSHSLVVNAYGNVSDSASDVEIGNNEEKVEEILPIEETPSTAFRIRQQDDHNEEKCELSNYMQDEPLQTTLHFDSGLTLPVSSTSESNKIALASSAKKMTSNTRESKSALPVIPKLEEPGKSNEGGDDVHQKLNFSALSVSTTPLPQCQPSTLGSTSGDKKKKHKERISRSKLSASRAMQSTLLDSDKETANVEAKLLQHVRLVFTSALTVVKDTLTDGVNSDKEGIEVLTLDPCYLQNKSEAGLKFFNDAQCIINSQVIEGDILGLSTDELNIDKSCLFLNNGGLIKKDKDGTKVCLPEWLLPGIESKDPSIHLLLILLAKIELSIQDSHKQYMKNFQVGNDTGDPSTPLCSPGTQNSLSPPSPSATNKKTDVVTHNSSPHDNVCPPNEADDTGPSSAVQDKAKNILSLDLVYRQKLRSLFTASHKSSPSVGEHFQNILKTWAHLNSEKDFTRSMNASIKELFGKDKLVDGNEFQAEDLVLMPLSFMVSSASIRAHEWRHNIKQLAKKWNEIISSGLGKVQQAMLSAEKGDAIGDLTQETKTIDSIDNILDDDTSILFKNESAKVSSGKNKKKKKRRRKRKLAIASRATGDKCQGNCVVTEANIVNEQKDALKVVCELSNTVDAATEEVCNEVVLPQTTSVTKATNDPKQKVDKTKSNATCRSSNGEVTKLNTDMKVSLVNGVNGTCVVGGGRLEEDENENSDAWETVEPKGGRGSTRNKKSLSDTTTGSCQPLGNGRKNKTKTKGAFRQRTSQRRKGKDGVKEISKDNAKDIAHSTLESVDEEIERKVANAQRKERNARHNGDRLKKQGGLANLLAKGMSPGRNARSASLRDVVMGHIGSNPPFRIPSSQLDKASSDPVSSSTSSSKIKLKQGSISNNGQEESDVNLKTQKPKSMLSADQNTATTVPETLSGLSAATPSTSNTDEDETLIVRRETPGIKGQVISKSKSKESTRNPDEGCGDASLSVGGGNRISRPESKVIKSAAPLLQTVIGPRDVDSAKSSVASSLEATREDDVGYHLLRSSEKLSDDMITFMDRRKSALSTKRRDRNLLLAALQETLQSIWAGRCRPEMYGSCATKLDLPSSDLDVVIRGLDLEKEEGNFSRKAMKRQTSQSSTEMNSKVTDESLDSSSTCRRNTYSVSHNNSYRSHHHVYQPLSKNGLRVMRLAAELELQPWAVQVKAIPTASVPVLKILADPSRLPGAAAGMDWIVHQHMAAAVAAAEMHSTRGMQQKVESSETPPTNDQSEFCHPPASHLAAMAGMPSPSYHTTPTPWRGADVMNGLLSLDITFEGSEHGGLGSTEYTNRVINESCRETGLPPESTPAVQVLVVIKELLAQRRLNEPFSGGLSSYAILLLVVAVMKERGIIKEEIERVERQRRAVASETPVPEIPSHSHETKTKPVVWPTPKQQSSLSSDLPDSNEPFKGKNQWTTSNKMRGDIKSENTTGWDQGKAQLTRKSSWAAIAKKSVTPHNITQRTSIPKSDCNNDTRKSSNGPMGVDLCDAVIEGSSLSTAVNKQDCVPSRSSTEVVAKPTDVPDPPLFPQGSNDVLEVLCSGALTAGKLLMHFLLFYGRHFDSQATCIDVGARHYPELRAKASKFNEQSPFLPREAGGAYCPETGVYTVDPVVVYDPWEESESNMNVARSCYAWSNIRCVFEQCFNTLSGVVERGNGTGVSDRSAIRNGGVDHPTCPSRVMPGEGLPTITALTDTGTDQRQCTNDVSPLLELLLSF